MSATVWQIVAIDCCEHILFSLRQLPQAHLETLAGTKSKTLEIICNETNIDLIVLGHTPFPLCRFFVSRLQQLRSAAMLLSFCPDNSSLGKPENILSGKIILFDQYLVSACKLLSHLKRILPLPLCPHALQTSPQDKIGQGVLLQVEERYGEENLSLNQIAQELKISPVRLARILKQQFGYSFRQLLRQQRVDVAKQLLLSPQYSIKEIAAQVGFADNHYFSRSFRQLIGYSPSEYRAQQTG
ncbi:MAG: helix-turn-helix transcriptional regulator [Blastocatellia bacterium]